MTREEWSILVGALETAVELAQSEYLTAVKLYAQYPGRRTRLEALNQQADTMAAALKIAYREYAK